MLGLTKSQTLRINKPLAFLMALQNIYEQKDKTATDYSHKATLKFFSLFVTNAEQKIAHKALRIEGHKLEKIAIW